MCQDESDSPRSYEDRSPRNTKQQINKTVPRGQFFRLVRPASRGIDSSGRNIAVVEIVSRGSNKGFAGESGVCSFSENWRCHGTETITLLASSKRGAFSILRSGYFYLDPYHEEHPRVFATNIRYRMMSLAWMETYGVS